VREEITVPTSEAREHFADRIHGAAKAPRWRSETQRDHDRLLYSSAFQRLGGITQVTAPELGRPFHTRLTHTLKVAQVARRSAERLQQKLERGELDGSAAELVDCLDADAAESAALAHDIGHPPFGHLAESVLNERALPADGFEGNPQSFRIVTRLALRGAHPGLDLTRQTLNGTLKYPWTRSAEQTKRRYKWGAYSSDEATFNEVRRFSNRTERSLEAWLMDWADDITYAVHDLDDFARAGLIPLDQLASDRRELKRFAERLESEGELRDDDPTADELVGALQNALAHVDLAGAYEGRVTQRVALRSLGSMLITQYIEAFTVESVDSRTAAVVIDDQAQLEVEALKYLTRLYVVRRPSLAVMQHGRARLVGQLWDWYFDATEPKGDVRILPAAYRTRLESDDSEVARVRLVTDLVAGMTEPTALELFGRMSGTAAGSVLDAAARGST
jgi:dGTPase